MNPKLGGVEHLALVKKYNREMRPVIWLALLFFTGILVYIHWWPNPSITDGELFLLGLAILGTLSVFLVAAVGVIGVNAQFWVHKKLREVNEKQNNR